jgi:hypothetical protein
MLSMLRQTVGGALCFAFGCAFPIFMVSAALNALGLGFGFLAVACFGFGISLFFAIPTLVGCVALILPTAVYAFLALLSASQDGDLLLRNLGFWTLVILGMGIAYGTGSFVGAKAKRRFQWRRG